MANRSSTSLNLQSDDPREPAPGSGRTRVVLLLLLLIASVAGLGFLAYRNEQRTAAAERQAASLTIKAEEAAALARQAAEKAAAAEAAARTAAEGRQVAEVQAAGARGEADAALEAASTARQEASVAAANAAKAQAEADQIRKRAEAERNRLETALGEIAETRRTALGLVMNLGGDHLKFEFDKAELSMKDRELLSRIAGILMTSHDYTISVNGHTDDVGSDAYNKALSQRRAQAVRDYLAQAGLPAEILSVTGHGKSLPLVPGTSDAARAKNRRVELAIANTQIRYGR
jgi:outer membrane protein OmpA-like peptidoglycan-associated protein